MNIQPYLSFEGRAKEAIEFYKSAIGAKVDVIMHFKDAPPEMQSQMSPESKDKVMHAAFKVGDAALKGHTGGILRASVIVALVYAGRLLDIGRSGVDRHHDSAGGGIGFLSRVHASGRKFKLVLLRHERAIRK